jgi:hypothetical protein
VKISKHLVLFSVPIILLMQVGAATQQQIPAGAPSLVTSPRPLDDAAQKLQETFGKVVTYEEPVLTWRGDLQVKPGRNPEGKWELFPAVHAFFMPAESRPDTDLASGLANTIVL